MKTSAQPVATAAYSVIVPSCGRPRMLKNALDSISSQSVLPQQVYLVIDEAEGLNDYGFLSEYTLSLQVTFTGGGSGGARARNIGLQQVRDEAFIFFLDDDDTWCPGKMEKQLGHMATNGNIIGITCWNYNVAHQTSTVKRVCARRINKCIAIWNTIGSFSFFGYRLTADTRKLRLCEDLSAAQDWEFYIRLSQFGQFSVVEEPLARYNEHNENRITGNASRKAQAWKTVYQKHYDQLSTRQRWFHLARINWKSSEMTASIIAKCRYSLVAIAYAIISSQRIYTRKIIQSATSSVLRGMGLKQ